MALGIERPQLETGGVLELPVRTQPRDELEHDPCPRRGEVIAAAVKPVDVLGHRHRAGGRGALAEQLGRTLTLVDDRVGRVVADLSPDALEIAVVGGAQRRETPDLTYRKPHEAVHTGL